jgi:uncharacterized membrane-anchored protein YhcB (DUF1043 family)
LINGLDLAIKKGMETENATPSESILETMIAEYKRIYNQAAQTSDRQLFIKNQLQMEILGEKIKEIQKSLLSKELR